MKIFLTGSTGFVGNNLLKKLLKKQYKVTALVRSKEKAKQIEKLGASVIIGDITEPESFKDSLNNHDVLIHLAGIRANWGDKDTFFTVNSNALDNFFKPKTRIKHIIATSSVYVMGNLKKLPANELSPLLAKDIYGKSKIAAEKVIKQTAKKYKIPYTIIRPAIIYGPKDNDLGMMVKLISLIRNKRLPIIGNGKNTIHLVFIDDLTDGYIQAVKKGGNNQTYIIAGEKPIEIYNLIEMIKKESNISYKNKHLPKIPMYIGAFVIEHLYKLGMITFPKNMPKEPPLSRQKIDTLFRNWEYDITKAQKKLGYKPKVDYQEGIRKTIHFNN